MSIVVTLQSGLHMLYLGQRRSYFSKVNKVLRAKLIFQHFERYAFVCYFMLHLITMLSLFPCISLEAKLKGRQILPRLGSCNFRDGFQLPALLSFMTGGPAAGTQRSFWATRSKCVSLVSLSLPALSSQWEDTIRTFFLSRCAGACQGEKYNKAVRSPDAPVHG